MPAISTKLISTNYADRLIRESGLSARGYSLISLAINGKPAFQLSRGDEIVEFGGREVIGAIRTLNAYVVAGSNSSPIIRGDDDMTIPARDVSALRDVLKAAAQDAGLNV